MDNVFQEKIQQLINKYKAVPFVHNGRSLEEGLDCLGFIIAFYKEFGIILPDGDGSAIDKRWYLSDPNRYVRGIMALNGKSVGINELQPLDLVYFAIRHNIITHTGVMISDREFIHMFPSRGLLVSRLDNHFWRIRFRGAVRLK